MEHEDLKHEDPRGSTTIHEEELDARLLALFRSVEAPAPSTDFAGRTMKAVKRAPLPPGRRPLGSPLVALAGWAAVITGVAVSGWSVAVNHPAFASAFTALVSGGIGVGVWLMQFAGAGVALSEVFTTTGLAVSRAVLTKEGSVGLVVIAAIGAFSLSALQRLLMVDGREKGVSQWQEL